MVQCVSSFTLQRVLILMAIKDEMAWVTNGVTIICSCNERREQLCKRNNMNAMSLKHNLFENKILIWESQMCTYCVYAVYLKYMNKLMIYSQKHPPPPTTTNHHMWQKFLQTNITFLGNQVKCNNEVKNIWTQYREQKTISVFCLYLICVRFSIFLF